MLPDRVSNPGPLTYESGALPIALRGPATTCSYRHFRSVLDLTEVQPEKLSVRGNPRKGIISVRILRPRSEIRKNETKQNHVRKLRNDSSK